MKIVPCEQHSPEWYAARVGIPTASKFEKIITPTGKPSTQWETYAHEILAEEIVGHSIDGYRSPDMDEGNRREHESVSYYEMKMGVDTTPVGFITDDCRSMGCSPDRLIGIDGLLELKNPKHGTQVAYLLDSKPGRDHWPQLQGALLITGRKWIDFVTYFPEMPELIVRVERDEPYIDLLQGMIIEFNGRLAKKRQRLIELGHLKVAA